MARILYIEDNADNRILVRRILMASDYEVHLEEASTAEEGIHMAQASPPDLILMDLSMPEMDGLTATHLIREISSLADVPIVALTANVMTGDRERTLAAGCNGYIAKPIDIERFPQEVMAYLDTARSRNS
jgi:two-component system cell cycle response regulator DivK